MAFLAELPLKHSSAFESIYGRILFQRSRTDGQNKYIKIFFFICFSPCVCLIKKSLYIFYASFFLEYCCLIILKHFFAIFLFLFLSYSLLPCQSSLVCIFVADFYSTFFTYHLLPHI